MSVKAWKRSGVGALAGGGKEEQLSKSIVASEEENLDAASKEENSDAEITIKKKSNT